MGIFDDVSQRVSRAVSNVSLSGAATTLAKTAIGRFAPKFYGPASKLIRGDIAGAAFDVAKNKLTSMIGGKPGHVLFGVMRNPLYGGITPSEAQRIHDEVMATQYAKKNLFFLEVLDFYPTDGGAQGANPFNLFATGVSFAPHTITGDAKPIGSGIMDAITGSERVEMRITTYDDAAGTIKRWFKARADAVARPDGTFGVPADYLVQIRILHASISDDVLNRFGGYEQKFIMRPTSLECELSRTEDNLEEIQMAFAQFDTFMFQAAS